MITFTFAGDEAGDVSFNFEKGASRYFVPAFIATQALDQLRVTLDLRDTHEFKFHKMASAEIRRKVFSTLARADFAAWALIVDKTQLPKVFKRVLVRSSDRESLIQVADLVAGAILRRDAQHDTEAFDMIAGKIRGVEMYRPY